MTAKNANADAGASGGDGSLGSVGAWLHTWRWLVLAVLAAGVAVWLLLTHQGARPQDVQFASSAKAFADLFARNSIDDTRAALHWDSRFIPVYVASIVSWIYLTGRTRRLGRRPWVDAVALAAVAGGILDYLENLATFNALDAVRDSKHVDVRTVTHYATAKWVVIGAVFTYLWARALQTPRRLGYRIPQGRRFALLAGEKHTIEPKKEPFAAANESPPPTLRRQIVDAWRRRRGKPRRADGGLLDKSPYQSLRKQWYAVFGDPHGIADVAALELDGDVKPPGGNQIGVACSGGGIRSACFTLGALQVLREREVLPKASTVTAVSGGGYLAAGWAIAASRPNADASEVFGVGSTEERWLRRHSALIPNIPIALGGVGRVITGIAVNLTIIWLVLFMVARPAGWWIHELHPELRSRQPYITVDRQPEALQDASEPSEVAEISFSREGDGWIVTPSIDPAKVHTWSDERGDARDIELPVVTQPGFVKVIHNKLAVFRQPHYVIDFKGYRKYAHQLAARRSESADAHVAPVTVTRDIHLEVVDSSVPDANGVPLSRQFRVSAPRVEQHSGTTGRPKFTIDGRLWRYVAIAFGAWVLVQLAQMIFRPVRPTGVRGFHVATWATAAAAFGSLLVIVVLPWLVYQVPPLVARLVSGFPGPNTSASEASQANLAVAAGGSALVALLSAARLLRGAALSLARSRPLAVAKVVVFITLLVVAFVVFIGQVQLGAANGPGGHLVAAGTVGVGVLKNLRSTSDLERWVAAGVVLLVLRYVMDAHATSLFPFYKHRMSEAFAVQRDNNGDADAVPYSLELAWADVRDLKVKGHGTFHLPNGPELVLCATVNAYGYGEAASGRKASSFTFSPSVIGGPDVGYLPTVDYLKALSVSRRKDVTVPAALAIAGAAFSPGMGKMSKGPIDNLLAVANARLGVWLPNPMYVKARAKERPGELWWDRPGWPQLLREVLGLFRRSTPYVYVSDGGHWENLGMVEALRRGCRNVIVVSAAGDGATSFSTIGEAFALAREELNLEIDIDLEPLRAPWRKADEAIEEPPDGPGGLRMGAKGTPAALAEQGYAIGRIYTPMKDGSSKPEGIIVILEANMSSKRDWDVTSWAEGHSIFPDDSTANQNFNHRQLESYRIRGRRQMEAALGDPRAAVFLQACDVESLPEESPI